MKKLLSILAGLAISASSASAVVACSEPGLTSNRDNGQAGTNSIPDSSSNNNNNNNNGGNSPAAGISNNTNPDGLTPEQETQKQLAADQQQMEPLAQKAILEDQFGVDGDYLNSKISGANSGNMTTSGLNNNDIYGNNDGNALINYLGTLTTTDKDGKVQPLIPSSTLGTIKTVLGIVGPAIKANGIPNPSDMGSMVDTILPLVGSYLKGIYSSVDGTDHKGVAKLEDTMNNKVFTKQIVNIINTVVDHGTVMGQGELAKYANLTLGESVKSIVVGAAYILAIATKDEASATEFSDMSKVAGNPFITQGSLLQNDVSDDAIEYVANTLSGIINKTVTLDVSTLLSSIMNDKTTLDNLSDMVQLLTLYLTSFDKYQWSVQDFNKNIIDADHVFAANGTAVANMDAVNNVRNTIIGNLVDSGKTKFNPLGLIKDVTYYLGDLDQADGEYRIQALLLILFGDEKPKADNVTFTLDGNGPEISPKATPLMRVLTSFVNKFMSGFKKLTDLYTEKLPSGVGPLLKIILLSGSTFNTVGDILKYFGFGLDAVKNAIGGNTYALIQSMSWNRGFKMSGTALSLIDTGSFDNLSVQGVLASIGFHGLQDWKEWDKLKSQGILDYLYKDDNIWDTVHGVCDTLQPVIDSALSKGVPFMGTLGSLLGVSIDLQSMADGALEPILGPISDIKNGAKVNQEEFGLGGSISSYANDHKTITITDGKKSSTFNTAAFITGNANKSNWTGDNEATSQRTNLPAEITSAVADKTVNGKTDIYVHVINMYDDSGSDSPGDHTKFLDTMYIKDANGNKKNYQGTLVGDTKTSAKNGNDNQYDNVDMTAKITIDGPVTPDMTIGGTGIWYRGKKPGDWSHWLPYYYYQTADLSTSHINQPVVNDGLDLVSQDGINMSDIFSKDITKASAIGGLSTFKRAIKDESDMYQDKTNLRAYYDDSKSVNLIGWVQASADSLSISRTQMANHALSWLLQLFAIPQFDQQNGYLGMPIASDLVNSHLGQAIVEIGNLIGDTDSSKYGIDISQYKDLLTSIIGTGNNDNIVKQLFDALNPDGKGSLASRLESFLGMGPSHMYDKHQLLGALIEAFQPTLNDPNNQWIQGYGGAPTTDAWNKLTDPKNGIIFKLWNEANTSSLSDEQWNAISNVNNFVWDPKLKNLSTDKSGNVDSGTWSVTYKFSYTLHYKKSVDTGTKDADGNEVYTSTDVYKKVTIDQAYTISMATDKNGKVTYTITK